MLPERNVNSCGTSWPIWWYEEVHCDADSDQKVSFFIYFCKEFLSIWGSIIILLLIILLSMNVLEATNYLNQFLVYPFIEYRAKWVNQMPVPLEEIARALGLKWNSGHRGKAWHSSLAWPDSPLGSEGWSKLSHLCSMAPLPSEGRSTFKPCGSPHKWTLVGWRKAKWKGFLIT